MYHGIRSPTYMRCHRYEFEMASDDDRVKLPKPSTVFLEKASTRLPKLSVGDAHESPGSRTTATFHSPPYLSHTQHELAHEALSYSILDDDFIRFNLHHLNAQ